MDERHELQLTTPLYGGDTQTESGGLQIPFVMPGEVVAMEDGAFTLLKQSPERVEPRCAHFGACGGCQYQMASYTEQVHMKRIILRDLLSAAGVEAPPEITGVHTAEPYFYRNRIRLRIARVEGQPRFGYNRRASADFLAVSMCPIAAPLLWSAAEALLRLAATDADVERTLDAANELELFANDDLTRVQLTFACAPRTRLDTKSFERAMQMAQAAVPQIAGAGAIIVDPRTGPTGKVLAGWCAPGLAYRVDGETYWISRGGFFQVNRFLVAELVRLVCDRRSGTLAWDLYAGVGLFSRVLARSFKQVYAVEANPAAFSDLRPAMARLGSQHRAVEATTAAFLHQAVVQRERPNLVVLDPPRAGAGTEACELLLQLAPAEMVYVSCDPTTLARDLATLQHGYRVDALHLVDLFPQTFHMETVVVLRHR